MAQIAFLSNSSVGKLTENWWLS